MVKKCSPVTSVEFESCGTENFAPSPAAPDPGRTEVVSVNGRFAPSRAVIYAAEVLERDLLSRRKVGIEATIQYIATASSFK